MITTFCFLRLTASVSHFGISKSMVELVSYFAFAITLAARFLQFLHFVAQLVT